MKVLVLLSLVALCYSRQITTGLVQGEYQPHRDVYQPQSWNPLYQYFSSNVYNKQFPWTFSQAQQQYHPMNFPFHYNPQMYNEVPETRRWYQYMQQYQQYYQQGVWPVIGQIYEQLTPSQTVAMETLINRIGFQNVEVLFNYLVGNYFHITPEQYQTLVLAMQQVGYPYVEEFLNHFAGERFYLGKQQITFMTMFDLDFIVQRLLTYTVRDTQSYGFGYGLNTYTPRMSLPMYNQYRYQMPYSQYQGYQGNYPMYQGFQRYFQHAY